MKRIIYSLTLMVLAQTSFAQTPPATWQEHWFEHNQLLTRRFYDNDVAIYYDNDVNTAITWPNSYLGDVWRYTKSVYGAFGSDPHMYAIFHTGKYSGGHPSTYFDASHDNRNVIDVGAGPWTNGTGGNLDITTHEVAHIVEGASKGIKGSPAFPIWGDSKWAEIFNYDVYLALGKTSEATRWYNQMQNSTDDFPVAGTHWFRDWFYPIYHNYGGAPTLNRFFTLLSQYFPKNGNTYSRNMNWGEFIHFWSGAAGISLKPLATSAFGGWTTTFETQFNQARNDFPFAYGTGVVSVYKHCNYGGYVSALAPGSYTLSQLQDMGVLNDDISSVKVSAGYQLQLFADNNFAGTSVTLTGDNTCLVANSFNDQASSLRIIAASPVAAKIATTDEQLSLYPNPVINDLRFNNPLLLTGTAIRILDVMGREVFQTKFITNSIDVSKLSTGVYTVVITKGNKTISRKFVKQ